MRAFLCVLDSMGIGTAPDAPPGDQGANTFGHVALAAAEGRADRDGLRSGPLKVPNLARLGLGLACEGAGGTALPLERPGTPEGRYGWAAEKSHGKDTPSGHWEMAGLPVEFDWGYFPEHDSFPPALVQAIVAEAGIPGFLGNKHASGTDVLRELGEEHIRTGKPVLYTSADSVMQIAAHETHFGLERLYELCKVARRHADPHNIGRIIARPFVGEGPDSFKRTTNRKDLAVPPHGPTLLDRAVEAGREVIGIGKIGDIFAHRGVSSLRKGGENPGVYKELKGALEDAADGALVFANFNDFDTLYGHRRDPAGYAFALEQFDAWVPEIRAALKPGDLVVISADHGCDPTWHGSDHTREFVPIIAFGPGVEGGEVGRRDTFADIGQTLAKHLNLAPLNAGVSFL
jgi:phosphopentomutase